jgi:hypothetical protein
MSAIEGRGKIAGLLAALAYNAAISLYWLHEGIGGIDNAQYFAIPAGFTLVILSAIFRDSLGPAWVPRFRLLGALAIYLSSALPSLMSIEHIRSLLFCLTLCIIGIACGIALRVRVYLYLAFTVFVTSVVTYLTRVGLDRPRIGAVFLSVFGLVGLGFGIYLSIRKDELLARYRKYRALLAEWE